MEDNFSANKTLPLPQKKQDGSQVDVLSKSLTMKGMCSPDRSVFNLSHSSQLRHIRNEYEKTESVSLSNVAQDLPTGVPEHKLNEMEIRVKSRMSAYGDADAGEPSRLSESLHSFSYAAAPASRSSFISSPSPKVNKSLNASWQFYNFVGVDDNEVVFNGANRKPSEAIFTIDGRTSEILVANQTACRIFGYKEEELCGGMKINNLFTMEDGIKQEILIERNIDTNGNVVMVSGKILEAVDIEGRVFVVSVWMKRLRCGKDARCVVILEPVDVTKGSFLFNAEGTLEDCDFFFAFVHGYEDTQDVIGKNIHQFIPALVLPTPGETLSKDVRKQRVTSRTKDTIPFPATIKIKEHDADFHQLYLERTPPSNQQPSKFVYKGFIWVFSNISGLVSLSNDGTISSCNANFLRTFLGYVESELLGKSITLLIPHFYDQIELLSDDHSRSLSTNSTARKQHSSPEYETSASTSMVNVFAAQSLSEGIAADCLSTEQLFRDSGLGPRLSELDIHASNDEVEVKETDLTTPFSVKKKKRTESTVEKTKSQTCDSVFLKSTDTCHKMKTKHSCLDGFSPHLETSTPKQEPSRTTLLPASDPPEKHQLSFEKIDEETNSNSRSSSEPTVEQQIKNNSELKITHPSKTEYIQTEGISYIESDSATDPLENLFSSFEKAEEMPPVLPNEKFNHTSESPVKSFDSKGLPSQTVTDIASLKNDFFELKIEEIDTDEHVRSKPKTSDYESATSMLSVSENHESPQTASHVQTDTKNERYNVSLDLRNINSKKCESQFAWSEDGGKKRIFEGHYYGQARHKDSSMLPILFEIKKLLSRSGANVYYVWISRDPDEEGEYKSNTDLQHLAASYNTTYNASTGNFQELLKTMRDVNADDPGRGPYNDQFTSLRCIGKGAFGFVNLAERKTTKEQFIVKFIRKEKVLKDGWVDDPTMGRVPFEIYLLAEIEHPNIVRMAEAYENEEFFQMVMDKHGDGIDLFEFIDRKPQMDEALASHMFRQVLFAADYLHSQKILHRDIKDENIIVDRQFNLKLIDFGSATYIVQGKLFNTFCGTVEYCSPEVLLGNWYEGRELEMWSIGVTLYTFIFGEHPFFDVEETIRAELFPPFKISNELMFAICWMLHPEVEFRAKLSDLLVYPWFTRTVDVKKYDYDIVLSGISSPSCASKQEEPKPCDESYSDMHRYRVSCSPSLSSSSSISSSTSSGSTSASSELEQNRALLREEYQKYLLDKNEIKTKQLLSKSL